MSSPRLSKLQVEQLRQQAWGCMEDYTIPVPPAELRRRRRRKLLVEVGGGVLVMLMLGALAYAFMLWGWSL